MGVHAGMHAYSWEFKNHFFEKKIPLIEEVKIRSTYSS